jgi:hypothetical protein
MHLDNYMRFFAVWQVDDPHGFAMKVLAGKPIREMKDRNGKQMHDGYLKEAVAANYPWMRNVYDTTNGFVHFGSKHIQTSKAVKDKENGIIETKISKYDKFVPNEARLEGINCMREISECILELLEGWIWTKNNPEQIEALRWQRDSDKNEDK